MRLLPQHSRYDFRPLPERKPYAWPGGKRLAFTVTTNIEWFAFGAGLGNDPAKAGEPQTHRNYSWRDYGNRIGVWRLLELLDELGLPAAHNTNSLLYEYAPQVMAAIRKRGTADSVNWTTLPDGVDARRAKSGPSTLSPGLAAAAAVDRSCCVNALANDTLRRWPFGRMSAVSFRCARSLARERALVSSSCVRLVVWFGRDCSLRRRRGSAPRRSACPRASARCRSSYARLRSESRRSSGRSPGARPAA